ncbi:hypothetical protein [Gluconobacter wancherniae]|uniref:hypothetical protein n=1 Tax=Gluconobacter wancherniae TaxID=1307955 RepID=UPI0011BF45BB|nr:hypothetical protein [Gluconobacter wancherniae]MBF0852538.1 hypothetical protein [Gluconobacter wancherniae]
MSNPKLLHCARFDRNIAPRGSMVIRFGAPFIALMLCVYSRASTALPQWVGTFSLAAIIVAVGWAIMARRRSLNRPPLRATRSEHA